MNKIVKNYIYNVIYNILVLIAPFITAPYLARVLGASNLGIYSYVNSMTTIIISVTIIGLSTYGSRQIAYERDDKVRISKTFSDIMGLRLFLGFLGTIVFVLITYETEYANYFLLYYLSFLANVVDCTWLFVGVEEMKIPTLKNIFVKIVTVVGIFIFVRSENDLSKYIFLLAASNFVGMISTYPQLRKYIVLEKPTFKSFFRHYKSAWVLFLPSLVATIYLQVDKVMIEWLTNDTSQVSFYDQAEKIVMIPLTFITVLSSVMMPRIANEFSKQNRKKIEGLLEKACKVSLLLAFPLMVGIYAISDNFIGWYLGSEFKDTATALKILSPIILSNTLVGISGTQYFTASNKTDVLLKTNILTAVMNVIINFTLIPKLNYVGAAIATLIANYTLVIVQYYYLNKEIRIRKMFEGIYKYMIASAIMFVVVLFMGNISASPLMTMLQCVTGMFLYMMLLLLFRDKLFLQMLQQVRYRFKNKGA